MLGGNTGPTLSALIDTWVEAVGAGGRTRYEPFAHEALVEASKAVFGVGAQPIFDLGSADFILDFGSDFAEGWLSPVEHARQLAETRDILRHPSGGAPFVYVGPRLSQTAGNADRWLAAKPGTEGVLALAIAKVALETGGARGGGGDFLPGFLRDFDARIAANRTGVSVAAIEELGASLASSNKPVALPPGVGLTSRHAVATNAAVLILNSVIGAIGNTVTFTSDSSPAGAPQSYAAVVELAQAMQSGSVDVLLIHNSNPVYSLPRGLGFPGALSKVGFVVSTRASAATSLPRSAVRRFRCPAARFTRTWCPARSTRPSGSAPGTIIS